MRSEQKTQSKWFRHGAGFVLCAVAAVFALSLSGCDLFPSSASSFSGTKYAVVVGINDYITISNDLHYCVADADSIKTMLEDAGWTVDLITAESDEATNQYATKAKIEAAIENAPPGITTFLFYYSGHGSTTNSYNEAYIVPSDATTSSYDSLISTTEFSEWLADVDATNKLVVLDSCYSGGFVDSGDSQDSIYDYTVQSWPYPTYMQNTSAITMFFRFGELLAKNIAASSENPSTAPLVISAAGYAAESQESGSPYNHGIFTYYFLEAAEEGSNGHMKGDTDGDNVLSCLEAYHYAENKLEAQTSTYGFLPHISGSLRDFALIDNR